MMMIKLSRLRLAHSSSIDNFYSMIKSFNLHLKIIVVIICLQSVDQEILMIIVLQPISHHYPIYKQMLQHISCSIQRLLMKHQGNELRMNLFHNAAADIFHSTCLLSCINRVCQVGQAVFRCINISIRYICPIKGSIFIA